MKIPRDVSRGGKLNRGKTTWSNPVCSFSHPDYTVGLGISPSQSMQTIAPSRGLDCAAIVTAGRESHPAPKVHIQLMNYTTIWRAVVEVRSDCPGALADLLLVDGDPLTTSPKQMEEIDKIYSQLDEMRQIFSDWEVIKLFNL